MAQNEAEDPQLTQWKREVHQNEREVLFSNEALVVTVLQALTGGALVAAFADAKDLRAFLGDRQFLVLVTTLDVAMLFSVLTAYWKHHYKLWGQWHATRSILGRSRVTHFIA